MSESNGGRISRKTLPQRNGARIELGEPVFVGGERGWVCPAKVVGRQKRLPSLRFDDDDDDEHDEEHEQDSEPGRESGSHTRRISEDPPESEPTHTMLLMNGSGLTAAAAQSDALARIKRVAGKSQPPPPVLLEAHPGKSPYPPVRIVHGTTEIAAAAPPEPTPPRRRGWLERLFGRR